MGPSFRVRGAAHAFPAASTRTIGSSSPACVCCTRIVAEVPEVRFAQASGSTIAYTVNGEGPPTICAVPPMAQNIEVAWESPRIRAMLERLASFCRHVPFDKRGTGMSDRRLDIPALDERVDELAAVMDAADIEHAFVHGLSEGGPMAIMFAATYPARVDGLILEGTGASLLSDADRLRLSDPAELAMARARTEAFATAWGTVESMTLARFAPTLLADEDFVRWWPRYERQSASRDALLALFELNGQMDAREVIDRVECPVLVIHRIGDPVIPIDVARETAALFSQAGADVTLVEVPGDDHYTFAGDMEPIIAAIERFTTGTVRSRRAAATTPVAITTLGEFRVEVDGVEVPTSEWGSRRARTLLKRLVAARGWPVTRDELIDLLWPDGTDVDRDRLSARLSVQLSAVRRVLRGGVVANRSTVRLDTSAVDLDLSRWLGLDDDRAIVERYGEFLPDDRYEDWTGPTRDEVRARMVTAARRVIDAALAADDGETAEAAARAIVAADTYDEAGHRGLVRALSRQGRHGEARAAHDSYVTAMDGLGIEPAPFDER